MIPRSDLMKTETANHKASARPAKRKATRHARRSQLIDATIDSLASRGYSGTTLGDVAEGAGLSRGIVNFHFESKEKLLVATLEHMAAEYGTHWRNALEKAGDDPAEKLAALVNADFDPLVCNRRKLAAWCAFWGEAKSRPTYQALCGSRDEAYQALLEQLCCELVERGGYTHQPREMAIALDALLEGLWLRLMMGNSGISRETAKASAIAFLKTAFPKDYPQ